ncbi:hypothetical protein ACHAXT_005035 [Thalassiosira profunda]
MASAIDDDAISQFLAISGAADPNVARQYLEMGGNNLEMAVSLYMDMGGGAGGGAGGGGGGGFGGGGDAFAAPQQEVRAPDATRTMRLLGGPDSPGRGGPGGDVPAALMAAMGGPAAREMMLRGMMRADEDNAGIDGGMGSMWAAAEGGAGERPRSSGGGGGSSRQHGSRRGSSNNNSNNNNNPRSEDAGARGMDDDDDDDDEYNYNDSDDDDDGSHDLGAGSPGPAANRPPSQPPSLSTMFAPPTHLMHRAGGFLGAKNFAKDARRWLLVNIQDDGDFACHALNRDVWRDELVENLVREGFVLWQARNGDRGEGQTYVERYKVQGFPHLAILDPRTGGLLWRKEDWTQINPLTAEQFVEIASDFCSRHSFDRPPTAARNAYGAPGPGGAAAGSSSSSHKRPIGELTEEEQLQAAIRASMMENADGDEGEGAGDGEANGEEDGGEKQRSDDGRPDDGESKPSAFEREIISMAIPDEPPAGAGTARVQIRMPDGKRLVRRFAGDDPVKAIYAVVAQSNEEAKGGRAFELKSFFPPKDLLASAGDSVSDTGLNGEAINVIWK